MKKRKWIFSKTKDSLEGLVSFTGFTLVVIFLFVVVGAATYLGYEQTVIARQRLESEIIVEARDPEVAKALEEYRERDKKHFLPSPTRRFIAKFTRGLLYEEDINEPSYRIRIERTGVVKGYGYGDGYVKIKD